MSEILTLMTGDDRRAFSAMVGALAQKELGHSPALTHYMQATGVLRSDADRVASCESFGLEDDGADKDLARQGAEGADRLDKSGAKVSGAADQAIQDMDELGSHLEEAKKKGNGVKVAVFAAAMATLHTAATLLKHFRSVRNSTENQKALISALKEKRAGLWSDLQKASKAYATTHVSRQGLEDAAHKYVSTRNELTSALNDAKLYKGMVKGSNVKLAIGASIGFAITFATYWVITKVVIGAIALAKKSVGPAEGDSAGTENLFGGGYLTPGTELFGFGKKRTIDEPKFHDRHTLMAATNHATECANDTVDAVHAVMSNLPKTADEWKAHTHSLDKIQSKVDSMDIRTKDPDKEFSQTGWSGADAARNLKSVQTSFDSINKNDNWVRDVIEELPKHIHDEHVLAAAKHFFHAVSGIYMDVLGTLYIALRELKRAADPARALVG